LRNDLGDLVNQEILFKKKSGEFSCFEVDLKSASDKELVEISNQMGLALDISEMKRIRTYFEDKKRNPTDVELQALGQAWSEHCCYKSSKVPLQKHVFGIEEDRVVAREDAGVMEFDKDHYYCAALESHNHPSAVEPYGGAATGVGGIVRDVVCLDGEEFIFIRNSKDEKTVRIGEYVEKNSKKFKKLNKNVFEMFPSNDMEVLSFNLDDQKPKYYKVKKLFKKKVKELLHIKMEKGKTINVTVDHPMMVLNDNIIETKTASELKIGDKIPILSSLPKTQLENFKIDLINELEKREELQFTVKSKGNKFKKNRIKIDKILKQVEIDVQNRCNYFKNNYMPLDIFLKLEKNSKLPFNHDDLEVHATKGRGKISAVIKVDDDFSRLVGYYLSEGCISTDKRGNKWIQWSFNKDEKEYIEDVCNILDKLEQRYHLREFKIWKTTSITVCSRVFGFIFEKVLTCGKNSYNQKIPSLFFKLNDNIKIELLKGILRGDGDIKISKRKNRRNSFRPKVRFATVSQEFAQQMCILLQSFGYLPLFYKQHTKKSTTDCFILEICNIKDVKRLSRLFSKKDQKKVEKYFGPLNKDFIKTHKTIFSVLVKEIEKIKLDKWVYDINVDNTHLFATSFGIITHNCMGAQPVAYIDPLFFGPLDLPIKEVPKGTKHPTFLFKGVVDGIRDYGNRIGIPTLSGQVYFHKGYTGNCLVNVGCIGVMKKKELIHSRAKAPGNIYIYVGGRTGRDGIHGVTFASAELTDDSEESSRSAVQVGDPITKEPLIHVTLECNRKGLLEGLKDFGGGGLSCVCGELAYEAGFGAEIHLDKVPLKEEGLSPWEIWVSESQERMMFLVDPKNVDKVLHICKQWDVTAIPIGKVIDKKITRLFYKGVKILEMDMDFYTGGPIYDTCQRPFLVSNNQIVDEKEFKMPDLNNVLKKLLSSINIASKDWVIRQYDHEVRGNTVIKPLQGKLGLESHGDATVLKPLEDSFRGLAITANINPRFMERDSYWGACSAIDETCRNLVAVGAKPDALLDCLNFGNPEKPEKMGEFYEACRGLGDMARGLKLPFMSGNVSFYNESIKTAVPPTPEIMGIGIVSDICKCVTTDFKTEGNPIYLIGKKTEKEMGGSEYYKAMKLEGGSIPKTDIKVLKSAMSDVLSTIEKGFVAACHDVSEGGIGVCLSEMCIGGDIGADIDISEIGKDLRCDFKLFSESNTRWIVEIKKDKAKDFEKFIKSYFTRIGEVKGNKLIIKDNNKIVDLKVDILRESWNKPIWDVMG
jgi:phosphoribosylformylglycinamidine synthase